MDYSSYQHLLIEIDQGIAKVTINRPEVYNAVNHPQYTPGDINTVRGVDSRDTRNHLIPGNPLFNDPTRVFSSHPRTIHLVARFTF